VEEVAFSESEKLREALGNEGLVALVPGYDRLTCRSPVPRYLPLVAEADMRHLIEQLAAEMRAHSEKIAAETRGHFSVLAEGLRHDIQQVAEGVMANSERLERVGERLEVLAEETHAEFSELGAKISISYT
jgi:hypothetical protein